MKMVSTIMCLLCKKEKTVAYTTYYGRPDICDQCVQEMIEETFNENTNDHISHDH